MKKVINPVVMFAPMEGVFQTLALEIYRQLSAQTGVQLRTLHENANISIKLDMKAPTVTIEVQPVIRGNLREQSVRDFIDMLRMGRERSEVPRKPEPDIAAEPGD